MYYVDNTKYLFEYANKHNNYNIRHIWITKNREILSLLKTNGYEVYYQKSFKAFWLQLRCGVVVYNKGLDDISTIPEERRKIWSRERNSKVYRLKK